MESEKVETTVKPATEQNIREFMQGESYQPGGQHSLDGKGMGSGTEGAQMGMNDATVLQAEPPVRTEEPFADAQFPTNETGVDEDFKQKYGDALNEKGEWRKTASEAMAELQNVKAEMVAMRSGQYNAPPQNAGYGYANTNYTTPPNYSTVPAPQPVPQLPETYFPDKKDDDIVEVGDVNKMVQGIIAPAVQQLQQQQMALYQQQNNAAKTTAGLTPVIEQRLSASYNWLQGMQEGPAKIDAMASLLHSETTAQKQDATTQKQAVQAPHPAAAAMRRVTYVENASNTATRQENETQQQRVAREFYDAKTAFEKRKVLEKYGMNAVNDFGPDYYTR